MTMEITKDRRKKKEVQTDNTCKNFLRTLAEAVGMKETWTEHWENSTCKSWKRRRNRTQQKTGTSRWKKSWARYRMSWMNLKARSTSRSQSPKSNSRFLKRINRIPSQSNSPWKSLKRWTTGTTWRMRMKMTTKKKLRRQASTPPNTPIRNKSKRLFWSCLRKKRRQLLKINNKTRWLQH